MKLLNLTPHVINIFDLDGTKEILTLEPSGKIARFNDNEKFIRNEEINGSSVPVFIHGQSDVLDMPNPEENIIYVVSTPIRIFLKGRDDIASPGELVRNDLGQPIGCRGLIFNKL